MLFAGTRHTPESRWSVVTRRRPRTGPRAGATPAARTAAFRPIEAGGKLTQTLAAVLLAERRRKRTAVSSLSVQRPAIINALVSGEFHWTPEAAPGRLGPIRSERHRPRPGMPHGSMEDVFDATCDTPACAE